MSSGKEKDMCGGVERAWRKYAEKGQYAREGVMAASERKRRRWGPELIGDYVMCSGGHGKVCVLVAARGCMTSYGIVDPSCDWTDEEVVHDPEVERELFERYKTCMRRRK